eukprot:1236476-Rhodomonas_salina.3
MTAPGTETAVCCYQATESGRMSTAMCTEAVSRRAISLRPSYAMPGTDKAYGIAGGTDSLCVVLNGSSQYQHAVPPAYANRGTDIAYGITRYEQSVWPAVSRC